MSDIRTCLNRVYSVWTAMEFCIDSYQNGWEGQACDYSIPFIRTDERKARRATSGSVQDLATFDEVRECCRYRQLVLQSRPHLIQYVF